MSKATHRDRLLAAALDYRRRGWSVIPIGSDKEPTLGRWKPYQSTLADDRTIRAWFSGNATHANVAGVGIVLGAASGGLAVRDFDDANAYHAWKAAHPRLAATLPTVKTGKGYHVYARMPNLAKSIVFGDGELRTNGLYVLAPPSRHPSGTLYEWIGPLPDGPVPQIDPDESGLATGPPPKRQPQQRQTQLCATERTENTEKQSNRDTEAIWGVEKHQLARIEDALMRTMPTHHGQRNNCVFRFARALKAIPGVADRTAKRLRPIVVEWHRWASPTVGTKDLATTLGDFAYAWENVRVPEGTDVLSLAMEAAESTPPPEWASEYSPECQLLANLCRELQRRAGEGPFFLSCVSAGRCVGVDKGTAHRWLAAFVLDGALEVVAKGSSKTRRATRYRYVASDLAE